MFFLAQIVCFARRSHPSAVFPAPPPIWRNPADLSPGILCEKILCKSNPIPPTILGLKIDQFRCIKIQPKTIDFNARLLGINPTNYSHEPRTEVDCFRLNFNISKCVYSRAMPAYVPGVTPLRDGH